jgi:hypothetical protein
MGPEQLTPGGFACGLVSGVMVRIDQIEWVGDQAVKIAFEEPDRAVRNRMVYWTDRVPLELAAAGAGLSRSKATAIRSDGRRERSASTSPYLFDPCPALSTSTDRAPALTCRRERDSIRWRACSKI